jgi:hypothetical protein
MQHRRAFLTSFACASTWLPAALATGQILPQADLLPGTPPVLDFHDGLRIPMDKGAFRTLWEDPHFWLTYGAGSSLYASKAMGYAQYAALGTMKLTLLTLAFAPQRLERIDNCGWRLKSGNPGDYVKGDVELPGKPFRPILTDDPANSRSSTSVAGANQPLQDGPSGPGAFSGTDNHFNMMGTFNRTHAFTGYMVMKQDATLDYVRQHAQLI